MKRWPIYGCVVAAFFSTTLCAQTIRIPQDCRETLSTDVSVHIKPEGRSDAEVRSGLRTAAAAEAIQQTTGERVRSKASIDLKSERGTGVSTKIDSRFGQRMLSQASGLVALQVIEEAITQEDGFLHATAAVCIPRDPGALKETINVEGFLSSRGEPLQDGLSALRERFSTSRSFVVTEDTDDADWIVEGRIDSVDVRAVVASGSSLYTQPSILGSTPIGLQRLQVTGHIDARNLDGKSISTNFDEIRNIPEGHDARDALNQWVPELLRKASADLEARLVAFRTGAAPPPKNAGPTW
jgi:hypothetical protein